VKNNLLRVSEVEESFNITCIFGRTSSKYYICSSGTQKSIFCNGIEQGIKILFCPSILKNSRSCVSVNLGESMTFETAPKQQFCSLSNFSLSSTTCSCLVAFDNNLEKRSLTNFSIGSVSYSVTYASLLTYTESSFVDTLLH
jgi:hypothetical protein